MFNVKKTLTNILTKWIVKDNVTSSSFTVPANGSYEATVDCSKSGYLPIGLSGFLKAGSANADAVITSWYWSGSSLKIAFRNVSSSARTITLTVSVLYIGGGTA